MKIFSAFILAIATLLGGCATQTLYVPFDKFGYGFTSAQVDGALHRVSYIARPYAGFDTTYGYTMYRAAELAQTLGATHFEVLEGPIDRLALQRFEARVIKVAVHDFTPDMDSTSDAAKHLLALDAPLGVQTSTLHTLPTRHAQYRSYSYIYVPIQPPPPPVRVSVLIRVLNAASLDANRGFEVNDLLRRLGPKVIRPALDKPT